MANIPLNPKNVRFGDIAQRANPQTSDPLQNKNNAGFPSAKPAAQPNQDPVAGANRPGFPPPRFSDAVMRPVGGGTATTLAETSAAASPPLPAAATLPVATPPAPAIDPNTGQPIEQPFTAQTMEGQLDANGNVIPPTPPALADIPEQTLKQLVGPNNEWLGSGPDPRTAAEKKAASDAAAAGPPQGGKSGEASQARDAAAAAGFEVPEGAGGGKGGSADKAMVQGDGEGGAGGEDPTGEEPIPSDDPPVDPQDEKSDVPGQGGNTDPDPGAGDFEFDDTGDKPLDYTPGEPDTYPEGPRITGHTDAARARIQEYTDKKFKNYLNEGGRPEDFEVYNPPRGKFNDIPKGPQRHAARMRDRDRFYRQQQRAK